MRLFSTLLFLALIVPSVAVAQPAIPEAPTAVEDGEPVEGIALEELFAEVDPAQGAQDRSFCPDIYCDETSDCYISSVFLICDSGEELYCTDDSGRDCLGVCTCR